MCLMVCTRPEIAFSVGQVVQFSHRSKLVHWKTILRIFAYFRGTVNFGISSVKSKNSQLPKRSYGRSQRLETNLSALLRLQTTGESHGKPSEDSARVGHRAVADRRDRNAKYKRKPLQRKEYNRMYRE